MKIFHFFALLLILLTTQSCTCSNWYEGFRQGQINECNKLSDVDRENCLRDTEVSYDRYRAERQKSTE